MSAERERQEPGPVGWTLHQSGTPRQTPAETARAARPRNAAAPSEGWRARSQCRTAQRVPTPAPVEATPAGRAGVAGPGQPARRSRAGAGRPPLAATRRPRSVRWPTAAGADRQSRPAAARGSPRAAAGARRRSRGPAPGRGEAAVRSRTTTAPAGEGRAGLSVRASGPRARVSGRSATPRGFRSGRPGRPRRSAPGPPPSECGPHRHRCGRGCSGSPVRTCARPRRAPGGLPRPRG